MTTPAQHLFAAAAASNYSSSSLQPSTSSGASAVIQSAAPPVASTSTATTTAMNQGKKRTSSGGNNNNNNNRDKDSSRGREKKQKTDKKTRSRLACLACKSTKQKCDGPTRVPCRRCELYGLECKFPPAAGVVTVPAVPPSALANSPSTPAIVTQKLHEIAARLRNIESALNVDTNHHDGTAQNHPSPSNAMTDSRSVSHRGSVSPNRLSSHEQDEFDREDSERAKSEDLDKEKANPIHEINDSVALIVGEAESRRRVELIQADDYGAPDVINRGTLNKEECQELFEFFFCSIHPWVMMLSLHEDRDAMAVRSKSSLLFHTILVLSTSFSSPFPSALHTTLVTYVNAILAPQILNPQPHELTTDFLRAIDLLNLYKPTQFSTRRAEGKDIAESMRASKVNGLASWMLQGILARSAERLDLASVLGKFSRAYSASASNIPIPKPLLRDLRLYYWLLCNDVHGNVQSGRRCNMDGSAAQTTTRLFSSLQLQPYDMRLAASVEMFEIARPILRSYAYERTRRIARPDLDRFNTGMSTWEVFWLPMLRQQLGVDPLAMSVLCPFAWFITLQFNAAAYVSWKEKRFSSNDSSDGAGNEIKQESNSSSSAAGGAASGQPQQQQQGQKRKGRGLTQWEFEGLERCVTAAEGLVFTLSEESRVPGGWRKVQWEEAERSDGWRKLVLDNTIVELSKWGMDAITCVAYIFPLVFLCKLVNEGILTPDLVVCRNPTLQQPWKYTQKLPRLLELGASFLDAVGMNPHHPAKAQAQLLRTLLESGVKGIPTPSPRPSHNTATSNIGLASRTYPNQTANHGAGQGSQPWTHLGNNPQGIASMNNTNPNNHNAVSPSAMVSSYVALNPLSGGATSAATGGQAAPGMDTALTNVLNGFDPMWTETGGSFWEWGQLGELPNGVSPGGSGMSPVTGATANQVQQPITTPGGGLNWGNRESK